MVKAKLEKHIQQNPLSVMIIILTFVDLSLALLIYMHVVQESEIRTLRTQVNTLQQQIEQ
jgi:heme/copper-type cytochrome/quinol oxidase subunit 4